MTRLDPFGWRMAGSPDEAQSQRVSEVSGRLSAIERANAFAALTVQAPWNFVGDPGQPAFVNNWSNYGAPESPLRFYADAFGNVYIAGSIVRSAGAGSTVFTLPAQLRPSWPYIGIPLQQTSAWVSVYTDGTVQLDFGATNGTGYRIVVPAFRAALPGS